MSISSPDVHAALQHAHPAAIAGSLSHRCSIGDLYGAERHRESHNISANEKPDRRSLDLPNLASLRMLCFDWPAVGSHVCVQKLVCSGDNAFLYFCESLADRVYYISPSSVESRSHVG